MALQPARRATSEPLEERLEGLLLAVLADPQQAAVALVDLIHDGQVLALAGAPHDLVDADLRHPLERPVLEAIGDCHFHGGIHRIPRHSEGHRDLLPAHALRPSGEEPREAGRDPRLAAGPGNPLDDHGFARRAGDPPHRVQEEDHDTPQGDELKLALVQRVVRRPRQQADRAHAFAALYWPDLDVELLLRPHQHELDALVHEALVFLDGIEHSLDQHREPFLGQLGCVGTPLYLIVGPRCACIAGGQRGPQGQARYAHRLRRPLTAPPSTSTAPLGREGDAFSALAENLV